MRSRTACAFLLVLLGACDGASPGANQPPIAELTLPSRVVAGELTLIDASASLDPDGTIREYRFVFGDGTPLAAGPAPRAVHAFAGPGVYEVLLLVRDDRGAEGNARRLVTVIPEVPCGQDEDCGALDRCEDGRCRPGSPPACRPCGTTAFTCAAGEVCAGGCCKTPSTSPATE